jgi:hypothetical protein
VTRTSVAADTLAVGPRLGGAVGGIPAALPATRSAPGSAGRTGTGTCVERRATPDTALARGSVSTLPLLSAAPSVPVSRPADGDPSRGPAPNSAERAQEDDRWIAYLDDYLRERPVTTAHTRTLAYLFGLSVVCTQSRIQAATLLRNNGAASLDRDRPLFKPPPPQQASPDTPGERGLAQHLRWGLSREDTVPALMRQYNLSEVYVRSQLRAAGWPRRMAVSDPYHVMVRPPPDTRPPDALLIEVLLGLADVVRQPRSAPPAETHRTFDPHVAP